MDYYRNADLIAKKYRIEMTCVLIGHGKHFADDTAGRDIYKITLKSPYHKFEFTFGQSIANSGESITQRGYYKNGKHIPAKSPKMYDVLACLQKYPVGEFDEFCSEFGYSFTSEKEYIKVKRIHIAVRDEFKNFRKLFFDRVIPEDIIEIW